MAHGTKTVYPGERNKGLNLTFQPPEEGQSIQRSKHCDKHGDKDEENSQKIVNKFLLAVHLMFSFIFYFFKSSLTEFINLY